MRGGEDPVMLIMPSDHVLEDGEVLATAYAQAYLAARQGALVTFGITPTAPLSGYGYIQADARRHGARPARAPLRRKALAGGRAALHRGRQLLLNSGMFAFQASVFLAEMDRLARAHVAAGARRDRRRAWRRCAVPA